MEYRKEKWNDEHSVQTRMTGEPEEIIKVLEFLERGKDQSKRNVGALTIDTAELKKTIQCVMKQEDIFQQVADELLNTCKRRHVSCPRRWGA